MNPLGLAVLAALTSPAHAQQAPGFVEGVVFEEGSGRPLAGAVVHVGSRSVTTDAAGRFLVEVAPGEHDVRITANDATRPTTSVQVVAGGTTELLVTWTSTGPLPGQVETPTGAVVKPVQIEGVTVSVSGQVVSAEDGAPVARARIYVRGTPAEAVTDEAGAFSLALPAGTWELAVVAPAYASLSVPGVELAGDTSGLRLEVVPAGLALADLYVRAPDVAGSTAELLDERKDSSAVSDVLGAEAMAKTGDASAASALRRVTGLTLVGGRYIYVRGLGERYAATLLNGARIPSPEPERRVVPLDMFPASTLDSVVVQKTFSPDMPAEFGGGVVQLRTKGIPDGPLISIGLRGAYNHTVTGVEGLGYEGGPSDGFGVDGGTRALPAEVAAASDDSPLEEGDMFSDSGYTPAELESFGESMSNTWTVRPRRIPPDLGFDLSLGHRAEIAGRPVGAMLGMTFRSQWDHDLVDRTFFTLTGDGQLEEGNRYAFTTTTHSTRLGGMLALGAEPAEGHTLDATTMVLRSSENEAREYIGFSRDLGGDIRVNRLRWVERMLITQQLRGGHELAKGERPSVFDWSYTFARASRLEPDRRETRVDFEPNRDVWILSDRPEGNQRFFSANQDDAHDVSLDITIPVRLREDADMKLKTGASVLFRHREVDSRRFRFMHKGPNSRDPEVLEQSPEDIFTPDNIGPDGFQFEEITRETDNYLADQRILAGYAMAEMPILPWFEAMAGVRVEAGVQEVTTFKLFDPEATPVVARLDDVDVLPAATFTFRLMDSMAIRTGYGRTVSRPEFRELSPAIFRDVVGGQQTFGNAELERATIDAVDLRWEWFPSETDVVSVSGFYKQFHKPIETIVVVGAQQSITYANALGARNLGVELEARKSLDVITPALRDVYVAANTTLVSSEIRLDNSAGIQTTNDRPLQGQSPWVVNAQLGYDNPDLGFNAAILYNVAGRRISQVGALGMPDTYVEPFHQLDVVAGAKLPQGFSVRFSARNLLDQSWRTTVGGHLAQAVRPGWSMALSLRWTMKGDPKKG